MQKTLITLLQTYFVALDEPFYGVRYFGSGFGVD